MAELSSEKRAALQAWLVQFEHSWTERALAAGLRQLPPPGDPLRLPTLLELVKIDLERRWQGGRHVRLESYLRSVPELGSPETVAADLIYAEYEARRRFGSPPDLAEFAKRFPRQADELRQLVGQAARQTLAGRDAPRGDTTPSKPSPAPGARTGSAPAVLPQQFGRYRIVRPLGQGGMGAVYLAHDTKLERAVALKVPHFAASDGPEVLERFYREAKAAATLTHPNLCPVHDVGEIDGVPFLTMTYIEGKPLSDRLAEGKVDPRQAAGLVRKLALALQEAHARGIVHRDLKPANVMIDLRGEPVIMDFGLARRVHLQEARLTRSGSVLGTPAYMAPEQVRGEVEALGPGCDVYSLGVILYELLTGLVPFDGPALAVLAQILTQDPPAASVHRSDLDPRLEAICKKAMARKPEERYATMGDMAAALEEYLRAPHPPTPTRTRAPTRGEQRVGAGAGATLSPAAGIRKVSRWQRIAAAAAALALMLGTVLYVVTSAIRRGTHEPVPAAALDLPAGAKFESLFNGKDLEGWTVEYGEPRIWQIENGTLACIAGDWKDRSYLLTTRQYASYILRFEFQLEADSAAGVVIRGIPGETNAWGAGPVHAVFGFGNRAPAGAGLYWARDGSTHLLPEPAAQLKPTGDWNEMEIKLHGPALRVTVNRTQVMSLNMTQIPERGMTQPGLKRLQGHIGFLKHRGTVRYRKIELEELLTPPAPSEIPPSDKTVVPVLQGRRALAYGTNGWYSSDRELVQGQLAPAVRLYFGDAAWSDYDFSFEVKQVRGQDGFSAMFRAADVWNYYQFTFGIWQNQSYVAETFDEAVSKIIHNVKGARVANDRWYRVRISVRGPKCRCYLDDRLIHEFTDPKHPHGAVGLRTWDTAARFRNFKVTDPQGKILFEGLPELPEQ
jgi:predicted Ser/Thr protein kinase